MLSRNIFLSKKNLTISLDMIFIALAWWIAFILRYLDEPMPSNVARCAINFLPLVFAIQSSLYYLYNLDKMVWKFISTIDIIKIIKAVTAGTLLSFIAIFFIDRLQSIPRLIFPLYIFNLLTLICLPRITNKLRLNKSLLHNISYKRVGIIGAGYAGEKLLRDINLSQPREFEPVIFIDDDNNLHSKQIHGIKILGDISKIPLLVKTYDLDLLLIAIPSASDLQMQRIVNMCKMTSCKFKTLPTLSELVAHNTLNNTLRDVSIEDILGRDPVQLDWDIIKLNLCKKTVLVTGGGGSIGSELCLQLMKTNIERLIIIDQCEYNLYMIDQKINVLYKNIEHVAILCDIANIDYLQNIITEHRPNVVFHAAAYKHVPMLEYQAKEAIRNNVFGTKNIVDLSSLHGVEKFILISTDKAVNPTNVMGATKRLAELICHDKSMNSNTKFITVRFGNVLNSAGSVVPLFKQQIENGEAITVTHPEITRYFMTIPEACQLILQSFSIGESGNIFVLDMGEPVLIKSLAEQMIKLYGKKPGQDINIVYTGLRPGEKLYEELFYTKEKLKKTPYEKLLLSEILPDDHNNINSSLPGLLDLISSSKTTNTDIVNELLTLIPEFSHK